MFVCSCVPLSYSIVLCFLGVSVGILPQKNSYEGNIHFDSHTLLRYLLMLRMMCFLLRGMELLLYNHNEK